MDVIRHLFLLLWISHRCYGVLDTAAFEAQIQSLANNILGASKFQKYVDDNIEYSSPVSNPNDILKQVSDSLTYKINKRIEAVTLTRDNIQSNFENYQESTTYENCCQCCSRDDVFGRLKFLKKVDTQTMCHTGRGVNSNSQKHYPANGLFQTMSNNFKDNPSLKWQYFGGEDGIMTIFPSNEDCDPKYDPRFRPWYSQTAFRAPKDVVIVIDKSGSMSNVDRSGKTLMALAKEAGKTVVDTLNPDDRIAVVAFSSSATTKSDGCFSSKLAVANPENKDVLNNYIDSVSADGGTQYGSAFTRAFQFFANTAENPEFDTRKRAPVILFLTDGQPQDTNYLQIIKNANQQLNNRVTILTFAFGNGINNEAMTYLENIARQRLVSDPVAANVTEGRFIHVSDASNLRFSMARYYDFFSDKTPNQDVTISVPYLDAFGLGLITSVCLPVHTSNTFRGVTCVDITLSELFSDATYFSQNSNNYAFISDVQTRLLVHPLVPRPADISDHHPTVLRILDLEVSSEMVDIVHQKIMKGIAGEATFNSRRVLSRGDSTREGVDKIIVNSLYMWTPLNVADLTLVVVIAQGSIPTSSTKTPPVTSFPYHRLDISAPSGAPLCRYLNRISITDFSVIKFAASAFNSPDNYLERQETYEVINGYKDYFLNAGDSEFRSGVKEAVGTSAKLDDVINKGTTAWHEAVWRYIGMREGVIRVFPGVKFVKKYDPTVRTWYTSAMAQKDVITISKPYVDAFGAGIIVSLAKAIFEPAKNYVHARDDDTIGAMGMDFTLDLFNNLIAKYIPECEQNSCFVIDRAGYIITHPDFVGVKEDEASQITNIHITAKEPSIASSLYDKSILVKDGCINFEKQYVQTFWRIAATNNVFDEYEIHTVTGTNIYVIVKKSIPNSSTCTCSTGSSQRITTCISSIDCQCPCFNRADVHYDECSTVFQFDNEIGKLPPCTPEAAPVDLSSVAAEEADRVKNISFCYPVEQVCPQLTSDQNCSATAGCQWCASCQPRGLVCETHTGDNNGGGKSNTTVIIAVVVVLVILIAVGAVVAFVVIKKRRNASAGSSSRPNQQAHDNHAMEVEASAPHFGHAEYELPSRFEPPPKYDEVIS